MESTTTVENTADTTPMRGGNSPSLFYFYYTMYFGIMSPREMHTMCIFLENIITISNNLAGLQVIPKMK